MNPTLFKPINEAKYLTAEKHYRYRPILRFFFEKHEKYQSYLLAEDVFNYLSEHEMFENYTFEELDRDLEQLLEWNNLEVIQDTSNVKTYEDYKKKRYRYRCTTYTVDFERMMVKAEQNLHSIKGSLEQKDIDRLLSELKELYRVDVSKRDKTTILLINEKWNDLFLRFEKLVKESTDYLSEFNGEKIEKKLRDESFLPYKDQFIDYLQNFIISLQKNVQPIEKMITKLNKEKIEDIFYCLAYHQSTIPRFDEVPPREILELEFREKWNSFCKWFVGDIEEDSHYLFLQKQTQDMIVKITKFAQQIAEKYRQSVSRQHDYLKLAEIFNQKDMDDCHKIFGFLFGTETIKHLEVPKKDSDIIDEDVWYFMPETYTLKSDQRKAREKRKVKADPHHKEERLKALKEYQEQKQKEQVIIDKYMNRDVLILRELELVEPFFRSYLLTLIGRAKISKNGTARTENGRSFKLVKNSDEYIQMKCTDGILKIDDLELHFI